MWPCCRPPPCAPGERDPSERTCETGCASHSRSSIASTGTFFANGRQLVWEYPRETPQGDQVDLVEVMDIANGLIAHHRVYWGWTGFKALAGALAKPVP